MKERRRNVSGLLAVLCGFLSASGFVRPGVAAETLEILDGKPKIIVVNGYSTSYRWPGILQRKIDKHLGRKGVVKVEPAVRGGTPIARWIDVKTGHPRQPWIQTLRPKLKRDDGLPVVVLCQQSLQWVYGDRREGIRNAQDKERIEQGADALERYAKLLLADGADLAIIAMHIYKHPMEPEIGNERLALAALMKRRIPGVKAGPDVWKPTKPLHPKAFARDKLHPNSIGAEVMAHYWFEALCKHDGAKVPAWSREEMEKAIASPPTPEPPRRRRRNQPEAAATGGTGKT